MCDLFHVNLKYQCSVSKYCRECSHIKYLGSHFSCRLLASNGTQKCLAARAVWDRLKSFTNAVIAKFVTTFDFQRIVERFKTD